MNKIDKKFLVSKPIVFVEREYYKSKWQFKIYKFIYILFSIFSKIATFSILVLTSLVISKTIFNGTPTWYFYATTVVSSILALIASLMNFFYVKEMYQKNYELNQFIKSEIIKYSMNTESYKNSNNREFELFHRVLLKMENRIAKEVEDERY